MEKVRVGILIDDMVMPAWIRRMLNLISTEVGVEILLVVKKAAQWDRDVLSDIPHKFNLALISIWEQLEKRVFTVEPDAFVLADASECLSGVPMICVSPEYRNGFSYFSESDIEKIAGYEITVLLNLGFHALRGDILTVASCGIWSYQVDDISLNRFGAAGVHEVLFEEPNITCCLKILGTGGDGGGVIYRSWAMTNPLSIRRGMNACCWKAASFIRRRLRDLKRLGWEEFRNKYEKQELLPLHKKDMNYVPIDTKTLTKQLARLFIKIIRAAILKIRFREQWVIYYHFGPSPRLRNLQRDIDHFKKLVPPNDRFWADPCVVKHDGKYAIFIEEMTYANPKGHISVIEFDYENKPVLPPIKVLERPYHLSYPFIFEDHGVVYMIPETQKNRTIELYRCKRFATEWEYVMTLIENIEAVDATIWRYAGKYWLFANVVENPGASFCDELFLFSADSLLTSDWTPHPQNPIVSDARRARPAGRIFESDGHWYRPSQECSGKYGRAVSIQRIELINEETYTEMPVSRIEPNWEQGIYCTHTYSRVDRLACVDAMRSCRRY